MVRANEELAPPTLKLSDALKAEGVWTGETSYPQAEQTNAEPIDIRGDAEPNKTGNKAAKGSRKSAHSK